MIKLLLFCLIIAQLNCFANTGSNWINVQEKREGEIIEAIQSYIETIDVSSKEDLFKIKKNEQQTADDFERGFIQKKKELNYSLSRAQKKINSSQDVVNSLNKNIAEENSSIIENESKERAAQDEITTYKATVLAAKTNLEENIKREGFSIPILSVVPINRKDKVKDVLKRLQKSASLFAIEQKNGVEIISNTLIKNNITVSDIINAKTKGDAKVIETKEFQKIKGKKKYLYTISKFSVFPLDKEDSRIQLDSNQIDQNMEIRHFVLVDNLARSSLNELNDDFKEFGVNISNEVATENNNTAVRLNNHIKDYNDVLSINERKETRAKERINECNHNIIASKDKIGKLKEELNIFEKSLIEASTKYHVINDNLSIHLKSEEHTIIISIPKFIADDKSEDEVYRDIVTECVQNFNNKVLETYSKQSTTIINNTLASESSKETGRKGQINSAKLIGFYGEQDDNRIQYELAIAFKFRFNKKKDITVPDTYSRVIVDTFRMGVVKGETAEDISPKVSLTNKYYVSKYEVTNFEYSRMLNFAADKKIITFDNKVVKNKEGQKKLLIELKGWVLKNAIQYNNEKQRFQVEKGKEDRPVVSVTWFGAAFYCNILNIQSGLDPNYDLTNWNIKPYSSLGYRLPTEAEWEYAARGGNKSKDYKFAGSNEGVDIGWSLGLRKDPQPVGKKKANELELFDMSGNAYEWCNDYYAEYKLAECNNPVGPKSGDAKIVRGGSIGKTEKYMSTIIREDRAPEKADMDIGFRPVFLDREQQTTGKLDSQSSKN